MTIYRALTVKHLYLSLIRGTGDDEHFRSLYSARLESWNSQKRRIRIVHVYSVQREWHKLATFWLNIYKKKMFFV
jgi:hypothetical protein